MLLNILNVYENFKVIILKTTNLINNLKPFVIDIKLNNSSIILIILRKLNCEVILFLILINLNLYFKLFYISFYFERFWKISILS